MFGLTQLGVVRTIISLIAVGAGIVAFARYGSISLRTGTGKVYVVMTVPMRSACGARSVPPIAASSRSSSSKAHGNWRSAYR